MSSMKVGILGSGDVGRALGKGFVNRQHEVKIASRTPNSDKLKTWVNQVGRNASAGTFAESAAFGDIIVLATNGSAIEEAIDLARPQNFDGKLVIDVTNQLDFSKRPTSRNAILTNGLTGTTGPAQASIRKDREVFQHCPELADGRSKVQGCRNDDLRKRYGRKTTGDEDTERVRLERSHRYWGDRKRGLAGGFRPALG